MIKRITSKLPAMPSTISSVETNEGETVKEDNVEDTGDDKQTSMLKKITGKFPSIPDMAGQQKSSDDISDSQPLAGSSNSTSEGQNMFKRFTNITNKFTSIPALSPSASPGPAEPSPNQGDDSTNTSSPPPAPASQLGGPDLSKYLNSATASAAASSAASSMLGMMKKAQKTASVIMKEGSVKALEIKRRAVEAADMDALQRRLESALDSGDHDISYMNFTYITERIIAMGFPGNNVSAAVRANPMDPIAKFLNEKHQGHYMIWNLSEEPYDYTKLTDQVLEFKFPGHPAPPLGLLFKICTSIENWLAADPKNVAVVHCLTGKGRTGTVIACFLAWIAEYSSPMEALQFVSQKRETTIEKMTIPSQRRYLHYFANMLDGVKPRSSPLLLRRVIINSIPVFSIRTINETSESGETIQVESKGCCPYLQIFKGGKLVFTTTWNDAESGSGVKWASVADGSASFSVDCMLQGDILIRCRHLSDSGQRISMFRAAFHTGYIPLGILRLTKAQLDGACQDERFEQDFFVDLIFAPVQADETPAHNGTTPAARTEGVALSEADKQAYDLMLDKDERFWADIATRKEQRMLKKGPDDKAEHSTPATTMFSIFSGDEEVHVECEAPRKGSWDSSKDDELMAHLESLTSSKALKAPLVKESFSEGGSGNKDIISSVDVLSMDDKTLIGEESGLDDEIAALAKLEQELGLDSFSTELQNLPVGSSAPVSPTLSFLEDSLPKSTTTATATTGGAAVDIGNDNFDELEEYLKTLSSGKKE